MTDALLYIMNTAPLSDPELFRELYPLVPNERKYQIDRLKVQSAKSLSLGAGLLLQKALSDAGLPTYEIRYGTYGKPYLAGHSDIRFNLSHSEERAVCLISGTECGCDTERIRRIDRNISSRFFSPEEDSFISSASDPERMFFRFWTLKESFMKAAGLGFSLPLSSFTISVNGEAVSVIQDAVPGPCIFREFDFSDGYLNACCFLPGKTDDSISVTPVLIDPFSLNGA